MYQNNSIELKNLAISLYGNNSSVDIMEYKMILQILTMNISFKFCSLINVLNEYILREVEISVIDDSDEMLKELSIIKHKTLKLKCCGYELRDDRIIWFYNERDEPIMLRENDLISISRKILKY